MNFPPGSWQLEAAKLVGAALFGLLVGVSIEFVKRRFARNQRLATFLTTVAGSLEGIASFFDKRETPYTHGHTLESAMAEFGRATRRILGDEALRLIRELNEVIQQAGMGDDLMDRTDAVAVAERKELSVRARRLAGDLLGEAAKLGVK